MSQWRREASERLPELQKIIASPEVDNPMMLWIELNMAFGQICLDDPPPVDLLARIWEYAQWCLDHGADHVRTAAALGFCEHLLDSEDIARSLPLFLTRADFLGLKELLLYHNSEEDIRRWLAELSP